MTKILLVDDEPSLLAVLGPVLETAGYSVITATSGHTALAAIHEDEPQVVLLDLGLPDVDGNEVIRDLRSDSSIPVIVISARHHESEKIAALDNGADDYVSKPFEIGELLARIRAAVRRGAILQNEPKCYSGGAVQIDFATRIVTVGGTVVKLSPKEYALLRTLALAAGQVVTHKRLLAAGWGTNATDSQYLRVYIGFLRQKIEQDPGAPQLLLTEPGVGYRLVGATQD